MGVFVGFVFREETLRRPGMHAVVPLRDSRPRHASSPRFLAFHRRGRAATYKGFFREADGTPYREPPRGRGHAPGAPVLVPTTPEIEALRPKDPPGAGGSQGGGGQGGAAPRALQTAPPQQ
jgi:hypothetical protein